MNHTNNATVDSNISRTQVEPPAVNPTGLIHPQKLNHTNNATEVPYTIGGGGVFNEPLFREYPTYDKVSAIPLDLFCFSDFHIVPRGVDAISDQSAE